jgi:nicotinate-nucleotide adenylyltransferase
MNDHADHFPEAAVAEVTSPPNASPLIIFGGTFDPPHRGHAEIARHALAAAGPAAWVLLTPAARSPFKQTQPIASDSDRIAMTRLLAAGEQRMSVWTDEIDRASDGAPSFMIDTVRRLHSVRPPAALRLLIGADQAAAFHRWREAPELLRLAPPLIACRVDGGATREQLRAGFEASGAWTADQAALLAAGVFECPLINISSTAVRAALATGQRQLAAELMPENIAAYAAGVSAYARG